MCAFIVANLQNTWFISERLIRLFKINIPDGAKYIIDELNKNGFEAYIVGGCVRDAVLSKTPTDWDITTLAKPEDMKRIFKRTIDTGILHGTVTVLFGKEAYEVTTYRVDGVYEDHRRPKEVLFTASLEEDLKRRDFTINAMAYNDEKGLIDIFGGMDDINKKIVKCVGDPKDRFDEDALRILRAIRFSAALDFSIEETTKAAIKENAKLLSEISAERIQVELTKTITSDHPDRLVDAYELGVTSVILPEFDAMMVTEQNSPYHIYNVGIHTIKVMENVPPKPYLKYAALLHDAGKPETKTTDADGVDHFKGHQSVSEKIAVKVLKRLKMDNKTIALTRLLIINHDYGVIGDSSIRGFRRFLSRLGTENFEDYVAIKRADMLAQSDYLLDERKKSLDDIISMYQVVVKENHCLKITDLELNGKDLIAIGIKPGKEIGEILNMLFERVLDEPELNNKETLLKLVSLAENN